MSLNRSRLPRIAPGVHNQYGAVPLRRSAPGVAKVLLITSRETRRWVIPKGWPMKNRSPAETAVAEALEEAGVEGRIASQPVGKYRYMKWTRTRVLLCEVTVFPLFVETELDTWPEAHERTRVWVTPVEAAGMVEEPELAAILRDIRL